MTVEMNSCWTVELAGLQRELCARHDTDVVPCEPGLRIGLASNINAATRVINGGRIDPVGDASGWYFWAGDAWNDDTDFYIPAPARQLDGVAPQLLPYLALPPGWRLRLRDGRVEAWQENGLLAQSECEHVAM